MPTMPTAQGHATPMYEYDAFGNLREKPAVYDPEKDPNPFRYCGEYYDLSSEEYYLRARTYNPKNGRFTSEDTIKNGLNWYSYCDNHPIKFVDPSGHALVFPPKTKPLIGIKTLPINKSGKSTQQSTSGTNSLVAAVGAAIANIGSIIGELFGVSGLITHISGGAGQVSVSTATFRSNGLFGYWDIFVPYVTEATTTLYRDGEQVDTRTSSDFPFSIFTSTDGQTARWQAITEGVLSNGSTIQIQTGTVLLNSQGALYPRYTDPRSGQTLPEPPTDLEAIPIAERVTWTTNDREEYRAWYEMTYNSGETMDWSDLEIHHIIPRKYGGTNDYTNLIVVPKDFHQNALNPWWSAY